MDYTILLLDDKEARDNCVKEVKVLNRQDAINSITYFSSNYIGIKPFVYQHLLFKAVQNNKKRIIVCSSRQIGKSIAIAIIALHAAFYNTKATGIKQNTKIGIISRSEEQARKLMTEIRNLMILGDNRMKELTAGKIEHYFTNKLSTGRNSTNTKTEIHFDNGSFIKCYPPTDACRGESLDYLMIDEAAFIEDELYNTAMKPTVSSTNGTIILSSTPNGQKGFFYDTFDPLDTYPEHDFDRYWFPYEVCENKTQLGIILEEKKIASMTGNYKKFQQEYEAKFTVDETAFLESDKIDLIVNNKLSLQHSWTETDCCLGIDYGMTECNTVLTITTVVNNKIRLLYQFAYPLGSDDNRILPDVEELSKRFKITQIVSDQCAQGYRTNQDLINKGYNVKLFNFRSDQADRNKTYYAFRSKMYLGLMEIPNVPELITEMKTMQEVVGKVNTSIHKASGQKDDRFDSFMMSCHPYLDITTEYFNSGYINMELDPDMPLSTNNLRIDNTLKQMKMSMKEYELWK